MKTEKLKILFASSEVYPFSKTGGLADVSAGLPIALRRLGHDVRIITPAYKFTLEKTRSLNMRLRKHEFSGFRLLRGSIPKAKTPVYFLDIPELYYRNGTPYGTELGIDWPDNAERFDALTDVTVDLAMDTLGLDWKPDVVHCNDWQTGLVPAKLSLLEEHPGSLFTIHNMAYLGLFSKTVFQHLCLPAEWWDWNKLEFHDQFSFLKAGILFADRINTVSPTYAEQIKTPEFGCGLEGVLNARAAHLSGILNGIDYTEWDPASDKYLNAHFDANNLAGKLENKTFLQQQFNLAVSPATPLIGMIGRMVEQKGYDLVARIVPHIMHRDVQLAILGSGDKTIEQQFIALQHQFPDKLRVTIGYDEALAHQIEAGADMFLMPSRFEPCGLNQMYSLRYGTLPVVHNTGGLADSVVDASPQNIDNGTATGFKFFAPTDEALISTLHRALDLFLNTGIWRKIQLTGMNTDCSWLNSAHNYVQLYQKIIKSQ